MRRQATQAAGPVVPSTTPEAAFPNVAIASPAGENLG